MPFFLFDRAEIGTREKKTKEAARGEERDEMRFPFSTTFDMNELKTVRYS